MDNDNTRRLLLTTRKALQRLLRHCDASPQEVEAAQQTLDLLKPAEQKLIKGVKT
jgi:hypothetical protein